MTTPLKYTAFIIGIFISIELKSQNGSTDTVFLLKRGNHSIFIDNSKSSEYYNQITDFKFDKYDQNSFETSLQYLQENGLTLSNIKIKHLAKRWIIAKTYKSNFYVYYPSDFYNHFKVSISDTAFIEFGGEGPIANRIINYTRIDNKTHSLELTGIDKAKRKLTIHVLDDVQSGLAVFREELTDKNIITYLMVDADKIKSYPIIVNLCETQKQHEFEFDEPDYNKLIHRK